MPVGGIAAQMGWAKTYDAEYFALACILECRLSGTVFCHPTTLAP
jgi:hypothetical protein